MSPIEPAPGRYSRKDYDEWILGLLVFFEQHDHLPEHLQVIATRFRDLAHDMVAHYPSGGPELTAGLRKLLEAKDCFVRVGVVYHNTGHRPVDL